jgi:hypothetical protein
MFGNISFSRLLMVALIAFSTTFMTVIATALQNTPVVTMLQLKEVLVIQGMKALSIAASAALAAVVAFFTRPDSALPANSLNSYVLEKKND